MEWNLDAALFQMTVVSLWPWWKQSRLRCLWWWAPEHPPSLSPPPPSSRLWRERRWSLPVQFGPPAVSACPLYESLMCRTGSKHRSRDVKVYMVSALFFIQSCQNLRCKKMCNLHKTDTDKKITPKLRKKCIKPYSNYKLLIKNIKIHLC